MRPGMCLLVACWLATITAGNPLAAAERQGQGAELERLQQQVNELTQLIKQMQEQHDKEIASLRVEIEKLREAPGEAGEPRKDTVTTRAFRGTSSTDKRRGFPHLEMFEASCLAWERNPPPPPPKKAPPKTASSICSLLSICIRKMPR